MNIDWWRVLYFAGALILSLVAANYGRPLIHGNSEAIGVIVNVFSILAGFLVTIMIILGEPSLSRGRSWRSDAAKKSNVYRRLKRQKWLFIGYLTVLGLIFISTLIFKHAPDHKAVEILEYIYLTIASLSFLMSILLPSRLLSLQMERYEELIEERRTPKK